MSKNVPFTTVIPVALSRRIKKLAGPSKPEKLKDFTADALTAHADKKEEGQNK